MNKIVIQGILPDLNKVINLTKKHWAIYYREKKQWTHLCAYFAKSSLLRIDEFPIKIRIVWHIKNNRKDFDNIVFAKKYILDGLVLAKIIPDDTLRYVRGFEDILGSTNNRNPYTEVFLLPIT